jgi:hypothetical protein
MYPCGLEGVREFLEQGADVNWVDPFSGRISLHNVADAHEQDHPDIVKALLDAGANPNVRDRLEVQTPLMYAAAHGYTESVRILIDAGADASIVDNNGRTALMLAEEEGHDEIVDLLSSSGPATRSDERFESLAAMVQYAIDWSSEDDEVSKEFGDPIRVTKSCRTCFHFNEHQGHPYAVCADYHDPTASGPNEPISIPESLADDVWCESWKEEELTKLLVRGWEPGGIDYHRRHPIITENPDGARMFMTRVLGPALPARSIKTEKLPSALYQVLPFGDYWCVVFAPGPTVRGICAICASQSVAKQVRNALDQLPQNTEIQASVVPEGDEFIPGVLFFVPEQNAILSWLRLCTTPQPKVESNPNHSPMINISSLAAQLPSTQPYPTRVKLQEALGFKA